jgi:hypothetical protein
MAGTFIISETIGWLPANWIFRNVLEELLGVLPAAETVLRKRLTKGALTGTVDLRSLERDSFRSIISAVDRVYEKTVAEGSTGFHDPSFYPAYVKWLDVLCATLKNDPRAGAK